MLAHRLRRWPNIEPTHGQCPVFTGFVLHVIYSGVFNKMQTSSNCSLDDKLLRQFVAGNKVEVQTYNSKRRKIN